MIYLDNNATTRVADEVAEAMLPFYREHYGNPHSVHAMGRKSNEAIMQARRQTAALIGARPDEIYFTSCGTESNAIVLRGVERNGRRKIVSSSVEHASVMALVSELARNGSIELAVVRVDENGAIDLDQMSEQIDDRTALVTVMLAQNETGVIHQVERIIGLAREKGALVHLDAVQAAGKIPIDVRSLDVDFLSLSGHKFHAPKGIGALFVRAGSKLQSLWLGGGQEKGLRSGTEAVPSIVAMGVAAAIAADRLPEQDHVREQRDRLEISLQKAFPEIVINGQGQPRLPNTANISFPDLLSEFIVYGLDDAGICISAGSACSSGKEGGSAVIKAMHRPDRLASGAVRFSLSRYTTAEEIDRAIDLVPDLINGLYRSMGLRPVTGATR